jgi:hypothetical protein
MTREEEVRFSEISCLHVIRFFLAYIIEFLLTYVRGFHPILESPTPSTLTHPTTPFSFVLSIEIFIF